MIYAGAQKNIGPSGVTVVIVRDDFLATANQDVPTVLQYSTHAKANSLYNTPPTFAIYVMACVLQWVEETGGLVSIVERNRKKAAALYDVIDTHPNLYLGHAEKRARSEMNVTFRLPNDELTKLFLAEAAERGFVGVKGYRTVGACASRSTMRCRLKPLCGSLSLCKILRAVTADGGFRCLRRFCSISMV
ncbi:hypothetical protein GCM10025858_32370 [Alicyclobacillus sacchari]|nr:hypothetical protein GCM10025858_32370 [Alicyclobacillus sacchari]